MFDFVRNHTRLALGFMLLLIIPSFIFFGVQGYSRFNEAAGATVAKVDGHPITRAEWDDAHKRLVDQLRRESPGVDAAALDTPEMRRQTLDSIIRDRVLMAAANDLHLYPTVARMARLFDSDPQYRGMRGADGKLNRDLLAAQGMTPEMFDQRLRQDIGVKQVLAGITQTVPPVSSAASAAVNAFLQRRAIQLQRFEPAAYRDKVHPSDAEIDAAYKEHEAQYRAPEQATIEYVVLDLATLTTGIAVSEADLHKAYADAAARYTVPEERRASHILVKADQDMSAADREKARTRAEALLADVRKNPSSFAELARKNSADPGSAANGGDLDFIGRGQMVKPFEDAVFALKPGEITPKLVETEFGFHIIQLTAVRGGQAKPFEAVRGDVEAELRKQLAQKRWADAAEQFTNTVYEQSDSLQPVVDKLKLEKKTATVQRKPQPGVQGPLASAKLLDAVFGNDAVRNKRNTDAVEVGPNQLASARVLAYAPARALPLAEVKDKVRAQLVNEQAAALARKEGQAKLAALKAGGNEALPQSLTISRAQPGNLPRPLIDAALRADAAKLPAAEGVDLGDQGYAVVRVLQVLPAELPKGGEDALRSQYAQVWGAAEADAYVAALKKRYKADVKPAAFEAASAEPAAAAGSAR